ncbi:hypothetical protein STRCI_000091 [Streptomyces cinnabarinus]|uniref:Zinc-finger domain-containing protein n=1 Tax=Streptomyces cinnabarinus TaxID=67287 RepID=A0ABY7K809_9ACTN|nr:hypothetical protein [Streptomyces cinnabarinus]WAZ19069.1 hypothetical protein STRCI_000091 [Streptomyces cinnabarinus]
MTHVDHAHLVDLARGNAASREDADALRHIARCAPCRQELDGITRVVAAASGVGASDLPVGPPPRVWQRIERELFETAEPAPVSVADHSDALPAGAPKGHPAVRCLLLAALGGILLARWLRRAWR